MERVAYWISTIGGSEFPLFPHFFLLLVLISSWGMLSNTEWQRRLYVIFRVNLGCSPSKVSLLYEHLRHDSSPHLFMLPLKCAVGSCIDRHGPQRPIIHRIRSKVFRTLISHFAWRHFLQMQQVRQHLNKANRAYWDTTPMFPCREWWFNNISAVHIHLIIHSTWVGWLKLIATATLEFLSAEFNSWWRGEGL